MPIWYNVATKKRAGELVHLFFYTGCVQCIALIFYAENALCRMRFMSEELRLTGSAELTASFQSNKRNDLPPSTSR